VTGDPVADDEVADDEVAEDEVDGTQAAHQPATDGDFEELLGFLKRNRGFDFTGYKRASLGRRIDKRMRALSVSGYDKYIDYLEVHPEEFGLLFNTILINVTSFFRDAATWSHLQHEILPAHLASVPPDRPIRVWSAGCASGEEAYTLAIVFAEVLGIDEFRRRVKIYGTDVDADALATARAATYDERALAQVEPSLRDKYFEHTGDRFVFRSDLRRSIIFGELDLLNDAPISRLELLVCRNTLMYFNAETQATVLDRFNFAINEGGILFLGKAETLLSQSTTFAPIDRKQRLFAKVRSGAGRTRVHARGGAETWTDDPRLSLEAAALDSVRVAALVVDRDTFLVRANGQARRVFGLHARDDGRPLQDLEVSYRPVELRGPIHQAHDSRQPVLIRNVSWFANGDNLSFDVEIIPLLDGSEPVGTACLFHDLTYQRHLEEQLRHSSQELEHAYEEVQSTNEELETTNEELQSTIEELETTNEELQSTNEELETMNEELQSTNDELHAVNDEVRVRSDELDGVNHFLQAVLTSFRGGVVVIDNNRRVRVWTSKAQDLWGLRADEATGVDFLALDIGLPVDELQTAIDRTLSSGDEPVEQVLETRTRRGKAASCRVSVAPLREARGISGAIIVMEVVPRDG
jgi:two-component system, chemotaxis family, CheB/CheR fusion protein